MYKYLDTVAKVLAVTLGILLPWHGFISVVLPDVFRFWKEGVLAILLAVVILENHRAHRRLKKFELPHISELSAFFFLCWGLLLIFTHEDVSQGALAFRYLGLGFFVFLLWHRWSMRESPDAETFRKRQASMLCTFTSAFVPSCVASVLFGTWAQWGGGFEVLQAIYSSTISSWVPGQEIPLYHEVHGSIRMQGGSSGPVAFAHLLFLAVFLQLWFNGGESPSSPKWWKRTLWPALVFMILFFGIFQSQSRAALIATVIILFWALIGYHFVTAERWKKFCQAQHLVKWILVAILALVGLKLLILKTPLGTTPLMQTQIVQRAGDIDHIMKPLQAIEVGNQSPFWGHLGGLGPAARSKNLIENNDDKALIAENVFADYFAQLGMMGFGLSLFFFGSVFYSRYKRAESWTKRVLLIGFMLAFLVVMNLATIFDMTPVSIAFFMVLALL